MRSTLLNCEINNCTNNLIIIVIIAKNKRQKMLKEHETGGCYPICAFRGYFSQRVSLQMGLKEEEAHPGLRS